MVRVCLLSAIVGALAGENEMTTKRTTQRLERYERRYRALANQLAGIGYIAQGSVTTLHPMRQADLRLPG